MNETILVWLVAVYSVLIVAAGAINVWYVVLIRRLHRDYVAYKATLAENVNRLLHEFYADPSNPKWRADEQKETTVLH